jgi:hypothetical protein
MGISEIIERYGAGELILLFLNILIISGGASLFVCWLIQTSLGTKALVDSRQRRNQMAFYFPFIPFLLWSGGLSISVLVINLFGDRLEDWQRAFLENSSICANGILATAVILFLVRRSFVRGLRGFGLNLKTVHKDFFWAVLNLVSIWPLILGALLLTLYAGKLIFGEGFQIEQHGELELLGEHSELLVRILIFGVTTIIAPVFEEMLFRGMFQTMIRSFIPNPWKAIVISSVVFSMIHAPTHWPVLFVLSMCLGYSYEKSASLFRPIFIHAFFNATMVITTLYLS